MIEGGQRFFNQPARRPVGRNDQEEAIYPARDDATVMDGGQGRVSTMT